MKQYGNLLNLSPDALTKKVLVYNEDESSPDDFAFIGEIDGIEYAAYTKNIELSESILSGNTAFCLGDGIDTGKQVSIEWNAVVTHPFVFYYGNEDSIQKTIFDLEYGVPYVTKKLDDNFIVISQNYEKILKYSDTFDVIFGDSLINVYYTYCVMLYPSQYNEKLHIFNEDKTLTQEIRNFIETNKQLWKYKYIISTTSGIFEFLPFEYSEEETPFDDNVFCFEFEVE